MYFDVTSPPHIHYQFDYVKDFSSLPWNYSVMHGHILWAPSPASEWRAGPKVILRFNVDTTSSWWRPCTVKGACSSWSQSPSSLVLSHFSKLLHPCDFVTSWPHFRQQTCNCLWRLLQDQRHLHFRLVFSSWRWTLSLAVRSNSSTAF